MSSIPRFARAYATKAHVYGNSESDIPLAIEYAERALDLDPDLGLTYDALGNMYRNQNRPAEAIEAISTAMKLAPNDPNILDTAAQFYAQIGDAEEAHRFVDRLLDLEPSFAFTKLLVAYGLGETDAMLPAAREAVKYDAHRLTRQLWLATLEHAAGNVEEAQLRLQIAEDLTPGNLGSYHFGAYSLYYSVLGHSDKANYYYAEQQRLSEQEFVRPAFWAMAHVGIGNYEKALENLHALADEIENGWVSGGMSALVHNHYGDPMLDTPEFVAARERILAALHYE